MAGMDATKSVAEAKAQQERICASKGGSYKKNTSTSMETMKKEK